MIRLEDGTYDCGCARLESDRLNEDYPSFKEGQLEQGETMTQTEASPAGESRGTQKENLAYVTRAMIMQILARFCEEVKEAKDISPFLDRIMEDLDRPGEETEIFSRWNQGES